MNRISLRALGLLCLVLPALPNVSSADFEGLEGEARLEWYLGNAVSYAEEVPKPASVIGHEVGEWHVSHDRLVQYFKALAKASERVSLQSTGRTYEGRELMLVAISSKENIARLEEIRAQHMERVAGNLDSAGPTVVALGYSVHGNEASGSNASMLVAYHLAAADDAEINGLLDGTIVLIDPSLNPDGLSRFAQWVNSNRGKVAVADRSSREHSEAWPGGRTNHYWFDLNRDWLPAQHPESRARLAWFHRWRPHVLADFHEMGTNQTFFFQPGVPSRTNPLTPAENIALTNELANFHAAALDEKEVLYYSAESYDDFYYGKGSTYPDIHGSIGLLFEQASARGHIQESRNGRLGFPYAVRNQFLTSLSTLKGAYALKDRLASNLFEFHSKARASARKDRRGGFVVADPGDPARTQAFLDVLAIHKVEVYRAARAGEIDGVRYDPSDSFFIPMDQPQYLMVRAMFDTPTTFRDNTFYDVSAWTLPLSFGLPFKSVSRGEARALRGQPMPAVRERVLGEPDPQAYAWTVDWRDFYAGRTVYKALQAGARARVATRSFSMQGADYPPGTVVIPAGLIAEADKAAVMAVLGEARDHGVRTGSLSGGLAEEGIDLGSPSLENIEPPRVALVVGRGVNAYEAGEVWHLLDQRFDIPVALLDVGALGRVDLGRYTHLVLVDGNYGNIGEGAASAMGDWVRAGGVIAGQRRAATWLQASAKLLGKSDDTKQKTDKAPKDGGEAERPEQRDYSERDEWEAEHVIGGAIFGARLDVSHPLGFGFHSRSLPVFHRGTEWVAASANPFENVAVYAEEPLLAGYASQKNIEQLANSVSVRQTRLGRGSVILFSDIPAFRAYWFGTSRLWLNALFFGSAVERVSP
ncbi:MAG: zinc carboxypeptidase [Gammaproteobacteria bacterium]|nr:zinc carboxypeptidase [Gammaproteobacteria bacterium]